MGNRHREHTKYAWRFSYLLDGLRFAFSNATAFTTPRNDALLAVTLVRSPLSQTFV